MSKKRGEKYDLILDAAVKVFAEKGFADSRVSDVAKGAGIADGTIYLYFSRKEDILISLVEDKMAFFTNTLDRKISTLPNPLDQLKQIISWHLNYLQQNKDIAIITQFEIRQSNPEIRSVMVDPTRRYFRLIEKVIIYGQKQGVFAADTDVALLRKVIFGTLDEVVTRWLLATKAYLLDEMIEPIYQILKKTLQA